MKKAYGGKFNLNEFDWLLDRIEPDTEKQKITAEQIDKKINTVETSSLGRIFDAIAAMLGLGHYNHFDAQLPMALEAIIKEGIEENYDFELINDAEKPLQLDLGKMIKQIIIDIREKKESGVISARFHNTLAAALAAMAEHARESTGLSTVALSGGVFCNRYLINRCVKLLKEDGFSVLFNRDVPSNDGGISVGQAAIAAMVHKK